MATETEPAEPIEAPAAPTDVAAEAGDTENVVTWTNAAGASLHTVYFGTETGVTQETGTALIGVSSPYTHTGLSNGTTYYYVVTATNAGGESVDSSEVNATPAAAGSRLTITAENKTQGASTANGTAYTTGGFSWTAGQLLVMSIEHCESATIPTSPTITDADGLAWTEAHAGGKRVDNRRLISAWTTRPASGGSTAGVAFTAPQTSVSAAWSVDAIDNTAATGFVVQAKAVGVETNNNPVTSIEATFDGALEDATNAAFAIVAVDVQTTINADADYTALGVGTETNNPVQILTQWSINETVCTSTHASADSAIVLLEIKSGAA